MNIALPFLPGPAPPMCSTSYCSCIITYHHVTNAYLGHRLHPFSFPPFSLTTKSRGGRRVLLSIPGLKLASYAHWPFACSTAEVNGVQDITIFFLFDKEARKNICFSSAQGCLLFHSFNIFFNDYTGFNQTCQWDSCEDNYLPTKVIPVPYSLTGDGSDCTSNVCKISYSVRFL